MKTIQWFIVIVLACSLFALADYTINKPKEVISVTKAVTENIKTEEETPVDVLSPIAQLLGYQVGEKARVTELFERFDLKTLTFPIIRTEWQTEEPNSKIMIYEMGGKEGDGNVIYLTLRNKIMEGLTSGENIKEVSGYGYNSFFFNQESHPQIAHMLVQVKDQCYGFQYSKESEQTFENIKQLIHQLMTP